MMIYDKEMIALKHCKKMTWKKDNMKWLDLVWEGCIEEGGLLENWVVPAEPDVVAGVDTERRYVLLKVAQLDSRFAELMQSLEVCVVAFWDVTCAFYLKSCHRCVQVWDICEQVGIFVCLVVVLFVNVCHQWACELKNVELVVCLVENCYVRLEVCDQDFWGDGAPPGSLVSQGDHCVLWTSENPNCSPHSSQCCCVAMSICQCLDPLCKCWGSGRWSAVPCTTCTCRSLTCPTSLGWQLWARCQSQSLRETSKYQPSCRRGNFSMQSLWLQLLQETMSCLALPECSRGKFPPLWMFLQCVLWQCYGPWC